MPDRPDREPTVQDLAGVNWAVVRQLRTEVSERISNSRDGEVRQQRLDREQDGNLAWQQIGTELRAYQTRRISIGEPALSRKEMLALGLAVMDSIFGLGRLERFLHEDQLEDIIVRGCDNVWLVYGDGRKVRGPDVADSDEELIADLQHLAATAPEGERAFSPSAKSLDLSIGKEGHRLSASAWFTQRPTVTIRRQGFTDTDLNDLVRLGAIDEVLAQFLSAAIKAGISLVVSGLPSAGKTTLIRALLNELHPDVALATIETEYELALHNMPERHHNVWAGQWQPGGEDGAGEISLVFLGQKALRQSVDRLIVGEVRGEEVLAMFDAMQAGKGSVSTIHANNAIDTIERIVTCAIKMPQVTAEFAYRQVAANINLIVHLAVLDETPIGGRKLRFVDEIIALHPSQDKIGNSVGHTPLFTPGPDGRAVATGNLPEWIHRLELEGFDPTWLTGQHSSWEGELPTMAHLHNEGNIA